MAEVSIRKATRADVDGVAAIYEKIIAEEENGRASVGWKRGIYPQRATAQAAIERGDLFVEESNGSIVGTAVLNKTQVDIYEKARWQYNVPAEQVMVMHTLAIDPDVKGCGLGRAFAEFYETYALQNGCHYLRIDTNERNGSARRFYKKSGYQEIDILPCTFNGMEKVRLVLLEKRV
ncbi:GNAT family N-acetyltransferase [Lachnospiraceae bacterium JLR.KK008]